MQVVRLDGKGWGIRALRDIRAHETIVSVPRRAILEVSQDDPCPWSEEDKCVDISNFDADQVWCSLPLYTKLALVLLNTVAGSSPLSGRGDYSGRLQVETVEAEFMSGEDPVVVWEETKQWVEQLCVLQLKEAPSKEEFLRDLNMTESHFDDWARLLLHFLFAAYLNQDFPRPVCFGTTVRSCCRMLTLPPKTAAETHISRLHYSFARESNQSFNSKGYIVTP